MTAREHASRRERLLAALTDGLVRLWLARAQPTFSRADRGKGVFVHGGEQAGRVRCPRTETAG